MKRNKGIDNIMKEITLNKLGNGRFILFFIMLLLLLIPISYSKDFVIKNSTGNVFGISSVGLVNITNILDMFDNKIINLSTPTLDYDASTKKYVDDTVAGAGTANSTSWNHTGSYTILANIGDSVGIGTTTPQQELNVVGDLNVTGSAYIGDLSFTGNLNMSENNITDVDVLFAHNISGRSDIGILDNLNLYNNNLTTTGDVRFGNYIEGYPWEERGPVMISQLTSDTSKDISAIGAHLTVNNTESSDETYEGGSFSVATDEANAQDITGSAYARMVALMAQSDHVGTGLLNRAMGISSFATNQNTGTITDAFGGRFGIVDHAGTITNSYGIKVENYDLSGTIINKYGLYLADVTGGTNVSYAIYSEGGDNYFGGNVGIGTTTPSEALDIVGNLTTTGKYIATGILNVQNSLLSDNRTITYVGDSTEFNMDVTVAPTSDSGNANYVGIQGSLSSGGAQDIGELTGVYAVAEHKVNTLLSGAGGLYSWVNSDGGGTITEGRGAYTGVGLSGGGEITEGYGDYSQLYIHSEGGGTIGTYVGNYIDTVIEPGYGTVTNWYGLYIRNRKTTWERMPDFTANDQKRIGILVGEMPDPEGYTGTTSIALDFLGTGGARDGIRFGGDTNLYRSAADTLRTSDSLIVDGNVGIGTTTPTEKLEVSGNFSANNTLFVTEAGRVGIGTASPTTTLSLYDGTPTFSMRDDSVAHGMTIYFETDALLKVSPVHGLYGGAWITGMTDSSSNPILITGVQGVEDPTDTYAAVLIGGAKKSGTSITALGALETVFQIENGPPQSGTDLVTVLGSGNVCIGTAIPDSLLEVNGSFKVTNTSNDAVLLYVNQSTGNVGVGTISPSHTLNVVGDVNITGRLYAPHKSIQIVDGAGGTNCNSVACVVPYDTTITTDNIFIHNATKPDSNVTINETGEYRISYSVTFENDVTNRVVMECYLQKNGTEIVGSAGRDYLRYSTYGEYTTISKTIYEYITIGEYIEVYCHKASGSSGTTKTFPDGSHLLIEQITFSASESTISCGNMSNPATANLEMNGYDIYTTNLRASGTSGIGLKDDGATVGVWVEDGGMVGIGLTDPTYTLEVAGNAGFDEYLYHNDDADTYVRFQEDDVQMYAGGDQIFQADEDTSPTLSFGSVWDYTFNSPTLFIGGTQGSYNGNVGIGTTTPITIYTSDPLFGGNTSKLDIVTGTTDDEPYAEFITLRHSGVDGTERTRRLGLLMKLSDGDSDEVGKMGGIIVESENEWANWPDLHLVTNNAKRLTIDSGGNVGIGTTTPGSKLSVNGSISLHEILELQTESHLSSKYGGAGNSEDGSLPAGASISWTNPTNADDTESTYAEALSLSDGDSTYYLNIDNLGFSIPAGAQIIGVEVLVGRTAYGCCWDAYDNSIRLIKGGTIQGDDNAATDNWGELGSCYCTPTLAYTTYGGPTDLWGLSLSTSDVNSSNFGFAFSAKADGGDVGEISIRIAKVIVYYTDEGSTEFVLGFDNNDYNNFKLSYGDTLGTNDLFTIDQDGNVEVAGGDIHMISDTARLRVGDGETTYIADYNEEEDTDYLELHGNSGVLFTGGNVGIGTSDPQTTLQVDGASMLGMSYFGSADGEPARWVKFATISHDDAWQVSIMEFIISDSLASSVLYVNTESYGEYNDTWGNFFLHDYLGYGLSTSDFYIGMNNTGSEMLYDIWIYSNDWNELFFSVPKSLLYGTDIEYYKDEYSGNNGADDPSGLPYNDTIDVSSDWYAPGNVGIGTNDPRGNLEVMGTDGLRITREGGWDGWNFTQDENAHLDISYPGEAQHVLYLEYDTGYVGVGTADPEYPLDVDYIGNSAGDLSLQAGVEGNVQLFDSTDVGDEATGKALVINRMAVEGDSYLYFEIDEDGDSAIGTTGALLLYTNGESGVPFMFLSDASSRVLVLDDAFQFGFDVTPQQMLLAVDYNYLGNQFILTNYSNSASDHDHAPQPDPTLFIHSSTDPDLANDEWISLTHDKSDAVINWGIGDLYLQGGNVGIGTTSPDSLLEVNGSFKVTNASNDAVLMYVNQSTGNVGIGTATPNEGKLEVKGGTVCVDTNSDGTAGSCIAAESDIRLKTNIQPIEGALDKIMQIRGVEFDWKWNDSEIVENYPLITRFEGKPHSIGIISQELETIFPEAIMQETIGEEGYKQIDYKLLVAPLIEALKELKQEKDAEIQELTQIICLDHPDAELCQG